MVLAGVGLPWRNVPQDVQLFDHYARATVPFTIALFVYPQARHLIDRCAKAIS